MATKWEAFAGVEMAEAGKRAGGKPRRTLVCHIIVVFSKTDVRALVKQQPHLKFREVVDHEAVLADAKSTVRAVKRCAKVDKWRLQSGMKERA
jgi:hypothetical protein